MFPIGISSCNKPLEEELFASYAKAGVQAMEISPAWNGHQAVPWKQLRQYADAYGVTLWSYHLPFLPFETVEPSALDKSVREHTVSLFTELIGKASEIGIDKYVIHASGEPIPESERSERLDCARETLSRLAEVAERSGGVIAVEDLPRTCLGNCAKEILYLTGADERLKVCFDTNHLLTEDFEPFLQAVGEKLITLHVSDYDFVNERHWLPGEGKLEWQRLLSVLQRIGYKGVWMYELGFEIPKTLPRKRALCCEDFVRNANELFAGETPTRIETEGGQTV